ncbi:bifunctional DNA-formamidopyrimidine glycosylase/DNA-(apurinic or apyrimidinic site) lyase [Bryobacter aggregatus]|uniref:bifunctional DNA-formamidopyrimidine glycosylase/DNA-(apurinic or apyrimidinic site) lyase n=1 Tax=Bryobacter aggregatus TaxID=360054 RepID=UPI0004E19DBF|nr:bifunctional DNA-formamidopyrimidine glycosylase/DNA-(apurinic or apyrimidinic site) lyase [Bryobacter aggregatus]
MPELPEVETVVRGLRDLLPGRCVQSVEGIVPEKIVGLTIAAVRRYGKFIVLDFAGGMLFVHLGMTGQLTTSREAGKFTRGRILLDQGVLRYDDIRKFGKIFWATSYPERGPDPLEISAADFVALARSKRGQVKALLLNQSFLRGMGNIYTDEALFRARIHPLAAAADLSQKKLISLHTAIREVLEAAIAAGGSSISDYVDARGEKGSFQKQHLVYGRAGQSCAHCGAILLRILVAQRGTTYCTRCQPL